MSRKSSHRENQGGGAATPKAIKAAFIKDHLDYKSAESELWTMKTWIGHRAGDHPITWTITEDPMTVLKERSRFDLVLIDYGGTWWHRSYEKALWLNQMFGPFANWAESHPGVLIVLATKVTDMFFEELSAGWHHWPDNIVKDNDDDDAVSRRVEAWFASLK